MFPPLNLAAGDHPRGTLFLPERFSREASAPIGYQDAGIIFHRQKCTARARHKAVWSSHRRVATLSNCILASDDFAVDVGESLRALSRHLGTVA